MCIRDRFRNPPPCWSLTNKPSNWSPDQFEKISLGVLNSVFAGGLVRRPVKTCWPATNKTVRVCHWIYAFGKTNSLRFFDKLRMTFGFRVRDRGVCLSSCCFRTQTLSSLELEVFCVKKTEQSEPRKPDPELARRAEVSGARPN